MKNKIVYIFLGLLIIFAVGLFFQGSTIKKISVEENKAVSPKDATYTIDGHSVTLVNGLSSVSVTPGSASKIVTQYFGNEVSHDFNGDGRPDVAFILTQSTGGSGTFYYAVVALNTISGYVGSDAVLLGDRIAPQTTEMSQNPSTPDVVVVNYADRKSGEAFTVQPSVGKSIWLKLNTNTMQFGEVIQNFEGEADPKRMTLTMQPWNWINTIYNNDTMVVPKISKKFMLTFKSDKTFSVTSDCNNIAGEYIVSGQKITFTKMISTMMYCEGSQEQNFTKMLGEVQSYMFTSKGELILGLSYDSGSMIFK